MFYCKQCKKDIIFYSVSFNEGIDDKLDETREKLEEEGKIILFNPLPIGPYKCPVCFSELEERKTKN